MMENLMQLAPSAGDVMMSFTGDSYKCKVSAGLCGEHTNVIMALSLNQHQGPVAKKKI